MARMPRVVLPGVPHHITQRGNRRQKVFFSDGDYRRYLGLLSQSCREAHTECWAYCLMPNHVHLILVPTHPDGLRSALSEAHRRYTRMINFRYDWRGHLWQERFHSFPMDEGHLYAAVRYVELNPVRAGLAIQAEDWPWSSAKAHLHRRNDDLVNVSPMLDRVDAWKRYLDQDQPDSGFDTIRKHARTGRPLGSDSFMDAAERITGRTLRPRPPGPGKSGVSGSE
ncbi:MAG TPA: transposase [Gammaproteobacteria bacterium]|nr:transposase [Gammaproteobacteria bacterium]